VFLSVHAEELTRKATGAKKSVLSRNLLRKETVGRETPFRQNLSPEEVA
jgi:hypothetical protein